MIREVDIVKVYLVAVGGAAVATMIPTRILPRSLLSLSQQRPHNHWQRRCSKFPPKIKALNKHTSPAAQLSPRQTNIHMQLVAEETGLASQVSRGATHLGHLEDCITLYYIIRIYSEVKYVDCSILRKTPRDYHIFGVEFVLSSAPQNMHPWWRKIWLHIHMTYNPGTSMPCKCNAMNYKAPIELGLQPITRFKLHRANRPPIP